MRTDSYFGWMRLERGQECTEDRDEFRIALIAIALCPRR